MVYYLDFVDLKYKPEKSDLICLFKVTPNKMSVKEAANTVALESSIGTWTKVGTSKEYVNRLAARVFSIKGKFVKIAYPQELFEENNAPNILSSIAGNVFGMKAVKGLRLEDISFPQKLLKSFKGPRYGIGGIRKMLKIKKRPLVGTIVKPKLGLKTEDHAKVAYEAWIGGCDMVKDDENLSSQKFNEFDRRAAKTLEMKDKAEQETGEKKAYLINVTAEAYEMIRRANLVKELGGNYVMHDILTAGFSSLQTLRERNTLPIHAHRAMHAAFTENPNHGISMMVIADIARLIGVDTLHVGTGIGKMTGKLQEIEEINQEIERQKIRETHLRLKQDWYGLKPVMSVCSGGIYPGHVPYLMKHFGNDIVIQAGGGIHWNPRGSRYGAMGMRQAVEAIMQNSSLESYAKSHRELREALNKFGNLKF